MGAIVVSNQTNTQEENKMQVKFNELYKYDPNNDNMKTYSRSMFDEMSKIFRYSTNKSLIRARDEAYRFKYAVDEQGGVFSHIEISEWMLLDNEGLRPAKAIAKNIKDRYHVALPPFMKEEIGNILSKHSPKGYVADMLITEGIDPKAKGSEYNPNNHSSCWFNGWVSSQDALISHEGGAIRFYDPDTKRLLARVWYVPINPTHTQWALFNHYIADPDKPDYTLSFMTLEQMAAMVADRLGVQNLGRIEIGKRGADMSLNTSYAQVIGVGDLETTSFYFIDPEQKRKEIAKARFPGMELVQCTQSKKWYPVENMASYITLSNEKRYIHPSYSDLLATFNGHTYMKDDIVTVGKKQYVKNDSRIRLNHTTGRYILAENAVIFSGKYYHKNDMVDYYRYPVSSPDTTAKAPKSLVIIDPLLGVPVYAYNQRSVRSQINGLRRSISTDVDNVTTAHGYYVAKSDINIVWNETKLLI